MVFLCSNSFNYLIITIRWSLEHKLFKLRWSRMALVMTQPSCVSNPANLSQTYKQGKSAGQKTVAKRPEESQKANIQVVK